MNNLLTISFLFAFGAFAQDEPITDMYWNNYSFYNPAMSGVNHAHEANVTYRMQPNGYFGSPEQWFVNYGTKIKGKHGLGVNYVNESAYFNKKHRVKLNYNYQIDLKEDRKLVFGTALSYRRVMFDVFWSPVLCFEEVHRNIFQFDLGTAYYGNSITAGLAVTQIPIHHDSQFYDNAVQLTGNVRFEALQFPRGSMFVETKLQTDFDRYRQDFNLGCKIFTFLEVGVGYRTSDAVLINLTGIIKKKYRIGYNYAFTTNGLSSNSTGTHEIAIGLRLPN